VIWHDFADIYLENYKKGLVSYSVLRKSFISLVKLLHPFMPFVTEQSWKEMGNKDLLISSSWPKA